MNFIIGSCATKYYVEMGGKLSVEENVYLTAYYSTWKLFFLFIFWCSGVVLFWSDGSVRLTYFSWIYDSPVAIWTIKLTILLAAALVLFYFFRAITNDAFFKIDGECIYIKNYRAKCFNIDDIDLITTGNGDLYVFTVKGRKHGVSFWLCRRKENVVDRLIVRLSSKL